MKIGRVHAAQQSLKTEHTLQIQSIQQPTPQPAHVLIPLLHCLHVSIIKRHCQKSNSRYFTNLGL